MCCKYRTATGFCQEPHIAMHVDNPVDNLCITLSTIHIGRFHTSGVHSFPQVMHRLFHSIHNGLALNSAIKSCLCKTQGQDWRKRRGRHGTTEKTIGS